MTMIRNTILIALLMFFTLSCGSTKKSVKVESESSKVNVSVKKEEPSSPASATEEAAAPDTITVREEKLVETVTTPVPKEKYFVIIGSFRIPANVEKYKKMLVGEGFQPFVLKNEAGLYRVAVFSYDDEQSAREKIRAIRQAFPQHGDTWLLIKAE